MIKTVTSDELETEIAQLLGELSSVQDELLEVLMVKRDYMAEGDVQGMVALKPREQRLCRRLDACLQQRAVLLQSADCQGLPRESLSQLVSQLSPGDPSKLSRQGNEVSPRMRLLQHQSLTNWVLAQRSVLRLSQWLEMVLAGGRGL